MNKNNFLEGKTVIIFIVVLLIVFAIGLFIPKSYLSTSSKKEFANFKMSGRHIADDATPNRLKWKKSFVYEKKKEKQQGSYIQYLFNKNKDKKKK